MATKEQITALAAAVWPDASNISVQDFAAGNVGWTGPDTELSGFALLVSNADGGIIQRLTADTLDGLQAEVEKRRQSKGKSQKGTDETTGEK